MHETLTIGKAFYKVNRYEKIMERGQLEVALHMPSTDVSEAGVISFPYRLR
jgi:hypothetical protein